jgi:hypothetical protein
MDITVKVRCRGERKKPAAVVRDRLKQSHPQAKVKEVFPGVESGQRAGMLVVTVPDEDCDAALRALRDHEDIEYAEPAHPRKAK